MKLIKIKTDHYVVVNNKPLDRWSMSNEDPYLSPAGIRYHVDNVPIVNIKDCRKIIYSTTPLGSLGVSLGHKYMPLQEVKELIGEVDVEKKMVSPYSLNTQNDVDWCNGYQRGYNQALEDNKDKKYTEEDIRKAIKLAWEADSIDGTVDLNIVLHYGDNNDLRTKWSEDEIIQSLQPKTEWEVEIVDDKLKLK